MSEELVEVLTGGWCKSLYLPRRLIPRNPDEMIDAALDRLFSHLAHVGVALHWYDSEQESWWGVSKSCWEELGRGADSKQ